MEVILKHTTTDGKTLHEVDLVNKKHTVTTQPDGVEKKVTKRWGTQEKFIDKLINKEIDKVKGRISVQKKTIGECIHYNKMDGIEVTQNKLSINEELLEFLTSFKYEIN